MIFGPPGLCRSRDAREMARLSRLVVGHNPNQPMSKKEKPEIVHNLEEFLAARGFAGNEPYTWARCFYKYTDCGPCATFLTKGKEAFTRQILFAVGRNAAGKLAIMDSEEGLGDRDLLEPDDIRAFGFEPDKTISPGVARSLKAYREMVQDFATRKGSAYSRITVHPCEPHSGYPDPKRVWVEAQQEVPAVLTAGPTRFRLALPGKKTERGSMGFPQLAPPPPRMLTFQGIKKGQVVSINMGFVTGATSHPDGGTVIFQQPITKILARTHVRTTLRTVNRKWRELAR